MATDAPESTQQLAAPRRNSRVDGRQKAAILLVALGPERAAQVFGHLNEEEIESLSLDMAKLHQVPSDLCQEVIAELVDTCLAQRYMAEGGVEYAREV
ncbi:MAG: flagellar motor switch protein FliG, partial [Solirubrobacteraceae bacterium]|nr:flagellar motor switch protein FliG [Solirubrobacteraceae bacterium]